MNSILQGAWLGFSIAAPVGPIGVLVMKRSLASGFRAGLASGTGAALADLIYGALAVAGVTLVAQQARAVALIGGLILFYLAWKSWRETPAADASAPAAGGLGQTFLLTLSNPMTILSFAALVASVAPDSPAWFVAGVFSGSMLWWVMLSAGATSLRGLLRERLRVLNRFAAVTLAAFAARALWLYFR